MNFYTGSDLACESKAEDARVPGTVLNRRRIGSFRVCELQIRTREASRELGKPVGDYVTLECGRIDRLGDDQQQLLARILAGELRGMAGRLSGKHPDGDFSVLAVGLGNAELTADAIGPKTVGRLTATRHLRRHEQALYRSIGCSSLSALAPGVMGQTGIEVLELLRGVVGHVKPDTVIVVDALAARSCTRLASTVQISDTGIEPGSGVGNHRSPITARTLGVPVIAVGVPTVVNSATLVYDALQEAGMDPGNPSLRRVLETGRSFFVSPKESDVITDQVAGVLSRAISSAFTADW